MCLLSLFWYTVNNVHEGSRLHPTKGKVLERFSEENLCSLALVVFQEASKPFTTPHGACTLEVLTDRRKEEHVILPLMVPLVMIVLYVLMEGSTQGRFSTQNQPCETLLLDGSDPALRIGVQVR